MNHSLLFVPAKDRMLAKIESFDADAYIIDLEDSIEDYDKEEALERLVNWLRGNAEKHKIIVRLNKTTYKRELEKLKEFNVDFILPKYEDSDEYSLNDTSWDNHKIYVLIETAKGLINIGHILENKEIYAVAFGAEDYTASVGMSNTIANLQYQKSRLVSYARAYGKLVYDTPSFQLNNHELFRAEVDNAFDLGFDGKLAINPRQLAYIKKAFSGGDLAAMQEIIDLYEKEQKAVLMIDGKAYEKMHIAHMKKIIKEKWGN